jgi:hypothetical protein
MAAGTFNLTGVYRVEQGATHTFTVTITNEDGSIYDLTGATAAAQIRETKASASASAYTCTINTTTGVITCTMANTITDDITFTSGFWDLELTETGGKVVRLLEGTVTVSLETTKAA